MKFFILYPIYLILVSAFIISCSKGKDDFGEHNSLVIEYGTVCGWCAGEETVTVSSVKVDYLRHIPCGEDEGTTNKTNAMDEEKWNDLISSFDYSYFLTLDYNECNVCADGCDEFIKITIEGSTHEIRYAPSTKIDGLIDLRKKLNTLLNEISSD